MQGQKGPKWSVKLANLHSVRTKVKADITRLYEIEVKERVEGQASKKAQEERYGCMDRQQLPPAVTGAQLLPCAPPSQPCSFVDTDLLRRPAGCSQCARNLLWPTHPERPPLHLQQRSGSSPVHYRVHGPACQAVVLLLGVAALDGDTQTVAACPLAFCLPCCTLLCAASERSMMHAEALDEAAEEGQARRGGDPETPDPPAPAKGRCPYTEAKGPGNDLGGDEGDGSGEEEPEEGGEAVSLVSDSEEEGQACKPTMRTQQGQVLCAYVHAE